MSLRNYVVKRVAHMLVTLWAFITLLFILFRITPGDPTAMYVQAGMTPDQQEAMLERLGLDQPLHIQYIDYLQQLLVGDFGQSYTYNMPVLDLLASRLVNTIILMLSALILAYVIGVTIGAYIGWKRGSTHEKLGMTLALVARSSPAFWVSIVLLYIFTFTLGLFPSGGMLPAGEREPGIALSNYANLTFIHHMVLPMIAGAIVWLATPTLLMRNSMIEILDEDFIEIKEAEGISEFTIMYKHAARNSILPIVTVAAIATGVAFGGSVVIETVFSWPGMGREMVNSLLRNDYPVAMGAFFIMGTMVIVMNFIADLLYLYLDPRVVYEQ